ncbi:MAG: hypothetical protein AAF430_08915 [Myxococcota bacterium]
MSVLPLVDLVILMGSGSVAVGFLLKAVALTTRYNPTFLGFSSIDMLIIAGLCFGFALVLTARTWLKLNEPHLQALQRRIGEEEAQRRAQEIEAEQRPDLAGARSSEAA